MRISEWSYVLLNQWAVKLLKIWRFIFWFELSKIATAQTNAKFADYVTTEDNRMLVHTLKTFLTFLSITTKSSSVFLPRTKRATHRAGLCRPENTICRCLLNACADDQILSSVLVIDESNFPRNGVINVRKTQILKRHKSHDVGTRHH